jgi:hypothetical protein
MSSEVVFYFFLGSNSNDSENIIVLHHCILIKIQEHSTQSSVLTIKFCTDLLDTNLAVLQQFVQVRQVVLWSMLQLRFKLKFNRINKLFAGKMF